MLRQFQQQYDMMFKRMFALIYSILLQLFLVLCWVCGSKPHCIVKFGSRTAPDMFGLGGVT
jgi:hypothetical protein